MTCGWCGSSKVYYESVNVGVGYQQIAPAECGNCGAVEAEYNDSNLDPEERRRGWYAGPDSKRLAILAPPPASSSGQNTFLFAAACKGRMLVRLFETTHEAYPAIAYRAPVFRTTCGLVFGLAEKPSSDAPTCLWCMSGVKIVKQR